MKTLLACFDIDDISWMFSIKDYWYAVIGALIGALIGIWWAKGEEEKKRKKACAACVKRLKTCIEANLKLLQQSKEQLTANNIPNFPFDTAQFNHWLTQADDALTPELFKDIDWQRYQLDHISAKFTVVNSLILITTGTALNPMQMEIRVALVKSLLDHIEKVLKELPPLSEKLTARIQKV